MELRSGLILPGIQLATEINISRENSEPASEPATDVMEVDEISGVPGNEKTSDAATAHESHHQGDSECLYVLAVQAYAVLRLQTRTMN